MSVAASDITTMKNMTAVQNAGTRSSSNDMTDKNMFLELMLKQMEYQDPTEPTSNEEWLSQMAQYSSLESAQNTQTAIENLSSLVESLTDNLSSNMNINQTLGLLGREVTIMDPSDESGSTMITGIVEEASFEAGSGVIKVNGNDYSIGYIKSVKN